MEESVQYLYEYQNGKRIRSLGFMKLEPDLDKCNVQIYIKDMDEIAGICFQRSDGSQYVGSWQEETFSPAIFEIVPEEYIIPQDIVYEKIQRQELSRLPRKYWKLANNSFLLHGFYNYHHLLYIEDGGEVWIGVPGIYHEKEQRAADAFGFGTFKRVTEAELDLSEEETNAFEDFGYWCRQIEMS